MSVFYNECDPYAAQWLRNLIAAGHIAPGVVDERDIRDIRPEELFQYDQCHFFAGIGVWPYALRRAGWADNRRIWTGSCPCQPFSAAGRAGGFADERHLWPHWYHLITQCRPPVVAGEQVASKDGLGWLDLVSSDLEGASYAFGASDLCAAGISVEWEISQAGEWLQRAIHDCSDPLIATMLRDFADWAGAGNLSDGGEHIRQRLYFVGVADDDDDDGCTQRGEIRSLCAEHHDEHGSAARRLADDEDSGRLSWAGLCDLGSAGQRRDEPAHVSGARGLDHSDDARSQGHAGHGGEALGRREGSQRPTAATGVSDGLPNGAGERRGEERPDAGGLTLGDRAEGLAAGSGSSSSSGAAHAHDSRRRPVDWLFSRDGKWRSAESGTFPLAHAAPARVGRLRAYGNALDAETATEFVTTIKAILDEPDAALGSDGSVEFEDFLA